MDLLNPIPRAVSVDFSSKCNLRCTYCETGSPGYVEVDMPVAILNDIAAFCRQYGVVDACLSASGETTMTAGWHNHLSMFLDDYKRFRLQLNSNFARPFSEDDLEALNKLYQIQVSIDSSSPELMKKQRTADLKTVIYNLVKFRQKQIKNIRETRVSFNCVVTRDNASHIHDLAILALLVGANQLLLCEASVTSSSGNPRMPDTLDKMTDQEAVDFAVSVYNAELLLKGTPTALAIPGNLRAKLQPTIDSIIKGEMPVNVMANFRRETRTSVLGPCSQPWDTVMVQANGNVQACCGSNGFAYGNANDAPLAEIYNGPAARDFRAKLLAGGPDIPCHTCPIASSMTVPEFENHIREAQERAAASGFVYPQAREAVTS